MDTAGNLDWCSIKIILSIMDNLKPKSQSLNRHLVYRNNIMHGFNNKSVDEVLAKYDEMRVTMEEFLSNVAKWGTEK